MSWHDLIELVQVAALLALSIWMHLHTRAAVTREKARTNAQFAAFEHGNHVFGKHPAFASSDKPANGPGKMAGKRSDSLSGNFSSVANIKP